MTHITDLIDRHRGEWLAIEITEESEGKPLQGELIYHSPDRWEVWEQTKSKKRLFITYAGEALEKGWAAAF